MNAPPKESTERLTTVAGALLGLALLLLIRRYWGIDHDATLYLGQGLLLRWPLIFEHDLFFSHGSQSRYTVLPQLVAMALGHIDAPLLFILGGFLGLVLFAAASWYCVRGLLPAEQRYWAWLGALCLPSLYGRTIIFSYAEPFLTPRPLSEALSLLSIGLVTRGYRLPAAICITVAAMFHPLQAISTMLVAWPWLVMQDRRWLHAAWLAIPVALLGLAGIEPFSGLFRQIDAAWLADLREFNGQLFVTGWSITDYKVVVLDAYILGLAWRTLRTPFGTWCAAALSGLGIGLVASLILVDGLHLTLPASLQLWRVHWLAHWFSMAAFAALLFRDVRDSDPVRALLLALVGLLAWNVQAWIWLPFAFLYLGWPKLSGQLQPRIRGLLGVVFSLAMAGLFLNYIAGELISFRLAHYRLEFYAFDRRLLVFPLIALGLPLLAIHLWQRAGNVARVLMFFVLLGPLVGVAAIRWDIRPPLTRALERNANRSDIFGIKLPTDAQIFWPGSSLTNSWLVLRRAEYFNPQQLSGVAFNRGTARDARSRLERVSLLGGENIYCLKISTSDAARDHCRLSDEALRRTCAPGPVPRPDYVILQIHQYPRARGTWAVRDPQTSDILTTYWLYSCEDILHELGVSGKRA